MSVVVSVSCFAAKLKGHKKVKGVQGNLSYEAMGVLPEGATEVFVKEEVKRHLYVIEIKSKTGKKAYFKVGRTNDIRERVHTMRKNMKDASGWSLIVRRLESDARHLEPEILGRLDQIPKSKAKRIPSLNYHGNANTEIF